jgi:hypothetical protein
MMEGVVSMSTFAVVLLMPLLPAESAWVDTPFRITVVDEKTGRGVPLVELETVHHVRYYTDSNGIVAFREPGLMDETVFFHVKSHGYEYPADGFGIRGKALKIEPGGSAVLKIKRLNVAERLYRVTGAGIYRDSVLTGKRVAIRAPVLNGRVFGSDSVVNAVYQGKIHWFWGDTNQPAYPLGNFNVPGATSRLPADGGLDPETGIDLTYFVDEKGFAREMARMPGDGPTWIGGLVVLTDKAGRERMFASYVKVRKQLEVYARGLAEFHDDKQRFEKVLEFPLHAPIHPGGHPFLKSVAGVDYVYFADPYALTRVRADPECLKRLADYEAFTCLKVGSRLDKPELDRGDDGQLRWGWKKDTPPLGPRDEARLVRAGRLKSAEALLHLCDVESGKPIEAHRGSVYWNNYRRRWVMIAVQASGSSYLGEVWYAEADTPLGPWLYARKIVTHERYSFYNPKQHPFFAKDNGRILFFEGTYTNSFSGNAETTPRYYYNQILYKLDLADPRVNLPVPLYNLSGEGPPARFGTVRELKAQQSVPAAFFALDRPGEGTVPVYAGDKGTLRIGASEDRQSVPLFHALPADSKQPPATTTPLYEFVHKDGRKRAYSTEGKWSSPGYERSAKPIGLVWRNPLRVVLPRE